MAKNIIPKHHNKPLVSVVMSVYNAERHVAQAIESILNQTHQSFELIIINDGSTDNTLKIIEAYDDPRISLVSRENKGLVASLNEGIKRAQGKYIARMDGDDVSLPKRLEEQVKAFSKDPKLVVCGTAFAEIDDNGNQMHDVQVAVGHRAVWIDMHVRCPIGHSTCMMDAAVVRKVGGYSDIHLAEDYDLWSRLISFGRIVNLPTILSHYRIHPQSLTKGDLSSGKNAANEIKDRVWQNAPRILDVLVMSSDKQEYKTTRLDQLLIDLAQEAEQRGYKALALFCKVDKRLVRIMRILYGK